MRALRDGIRLDFVGIAVSTATSAIWNVTYRPWPMIPAPIFTSFCRNEASDQCLIASSKARVRMKLKSKLVVAEPHARQPGPHNRVLALLDVLLGRAALIVEGDEQRPAL